ncbi:hypothetical protein ABZ876_10915 [Streptomyces sp. NPDC046931]|uniref:hypothetical protein n=1 Tax=Streptomyces sp. NPDC046931 TaxID=3154806 RepID=UPI0033C8CA00
MASRHVIRLATAFTAAATLLLTVPHAAQTAQATTLTGCRVPAVVRIDGHVTHRTYHTSRGMTRPRPRPHGDALRHAGPCRRITR